MIAGDTNAWIDYSKGLASGHALKFEDALRTGTLVLPEPVFFELLSGPGLTQQLETLLASIPRLEITQGFWRRAARLRRGLLRKNRRARAMDSLIAQNCIDHSTPLITGDQDFRHFIPYGLKLL